MNSPSAEHLGAQHLASAAQAFGAGDLDAARLSLLEAVKLEPNNPEIHNGLSAVAYRQGDIGEAVKHIKAAISNAPGHWGFWKQLIEMLMDRALHADAAHACEQAAKHAGKNVELMNFWGVALQSTGDHLQASEKLEEGTRLDKSNATVHRNLSLNLMKLERLEECVEAFTRSTTPYSPSPTTGDGVEPGPDIPVVEANYARLAGKYDANALHVRMADRMYQLMIDTFGGETDGGINILDCACGTGLLGRKVRPLAKTLAGIDLSPDMIERAETSGNYDQLFVGDMAETMRGLPGKLDAKIEAKFDAIACNSAIYHVADLSPFFSAAAGLLSDGGYLFVSTDPCDDAFDIRETCANEYAHSRAYLRRLAEQNGLSVISITVMEHRAYPGFWCVFQL